MLLRPCTFVAPARDPLRPVGRRLVDRTQLEHARCGSTVVGETPAPHHDMVARDLCGRPFEFGPPLGQQLVGGESRNLGRSRVVRTSYPERGTTGFHDGLPPRTAAEMGQQRRLDRGPGERAVPVLERGQPHEDAGCAEAALAGTRREEGVHPTGLELGAQSLDGGDRSTSETTDRGDACHTCGTIHPDRAAPALTLGTAPVLDRTAPQLLPERVKKRGPMAVVDLHGGPVKEEGNG